MELQNDNCYIVNILSFLHVFCIETSVISSQVVVLPTVTQNPWSSECHHNTRRACSIHQERTCAILLNTGSLVRL